MDQWAIGCEAFAFIAEDLGIVPDFVRASLTMLGVPGYRVFRWEADWDEQTKALKAFRDPLRYPAISVATSPRLASRIVWSCRYRYVSRCVRR